MQTSRFLRYLAMGMLGFFVSTVRSDELAGQPEDSDQDALADYYHPDQVQTVQLTIADEDQRRMLAALPERIYVPATFQWRDVVKKRVAVRFKGNSSSHPQQSHKRSYLVRFDEFDSAQRFFGLQRVSFDNGVQFGSLFSEPIITEILRDQGLPVHRCNFAKVYVNGQYQGVYVNVERIDETFLARKFPQGGALFKVDEGGPGANLQVQSDDPSFYAKTFQPKNDVAGQESSQRALLTMLKAIADAQASGSTESHALFEMDQLLRVAAVMLFSGAFDQMTGWNPHNYYLFYDPAQQRWYYLPWDLDVGFSETAFGRIPVLDAWHAAWLVPSSAPPNPLLESILSHPPMLARYRTLAVEILEAYFQPQRLSNVLDKKYQLVKADLATDPFPHRRATSPDDRGYEDIVDSMKVFIQKRYHTAKSQLQNPGPRPPRTALQGQPGMPPQLAEKMMRIQQRMMQKQQEIQAIHAMMQQVGRMIQQGKIKEAEQALDRVETQFFATP